MNRREEFAVRICAGILASDNDGNVSFDFARRAAIEEADKLIQDLNESNAEGWITDRDPEEEGYYIITERRGTTDVVGEDEWFDGGWENGGSVLAWMPLPEPFGGEHE